MQPKRSHGKASWVKKMLKALLIMGVVTVALSLIVGHPTQKLKWLTTHKCKNKQQLVSGDDGSFESSHICQCMSLIALATRQRMHKRSTETDFLPFNLRYS